MSTEEQKSKDGKKMKRQLGVPAVFAICSGAMFSSGFFLLPGLAAEETGPSLPLVYLIASLLMLPAIFSMAELSSAIPRSGGPYLFLTRSLGPFIGLIGALGKYLQMVLNGAFAFVGVGVYLSLVLDVSIQPVAIGLIAGFTILNLMGARQTAHIEVILVSVLLILLCYFLVAGISQINTESINLREQFMPLLPQGTQGLISAIALVFISFGGMGQVASVSEEIKNPSRSVPRGMLLALAVAVVIYLLGTSVMIALLSPNSLQGDNAPVATAAEQFTVLPLPVMVVVIAALAGFASAGNAAIFAATRYPLALARDRLIWSGFGRLDAKGVPRNSVIATGILLVILVLAFDVKGIAKLASAFLLFVFMGMCLAVAIFRESKIDEYQPGFRSPLYPWVQIIGIIVYLALIGWSGLKSIGFILSVCILGYLWYRFGIQEKKRRSAAIYRLFQRLGQKGRKISGTTEIGLPMLGGIQLSHLVERAIIFDLDKEADLEKVIEKAADALKDNLGGDRKEMARHLQDEVSHWRSPLRSQVAVSPVLLQGIEQPELVIIRGNIRLHKNTVQGLIVLVDDEESSDRLMKLISQLEAIIFHSDFPQLWRDAKDPKELKEALKRDLLSIQTLTISIENSAPTNTLINKNLQEVALPEGSLVVLIIRNRKTIIPNGSTEIREGDEITLLAREEAMAKLKKKFTHKNR